MEENTCENIREVYMSDSQIEEAISKRKFFNFHSSNLRLRKLTLTLPAFPKFATMLLGEINNLLKKTIFGSLRFLKLYLLNHPSHAAFSIASIILMLITLNEATRINKEYNDSLISNQLLSTIASKSYFSRNYENELNSAGAPKWAQQESIKAIIVSARRAGLSISQQAVLLATAEVESGFNPLARAKTSSACGLFQFISTTGERYGLSEADCTDPWMNAEAAIKHYKENYDKKISLKLTNLKGLEKAFKNFELSYYLHHDGMSSSNPDDSVKAVVLKGTSFLIQTYHDLKEEQQRNVEHNKFTNKIKERLLAHLDSVRISIRNFAML